MIHLRKQGLCHLIPNYELSRAVRRNVAWNERAALPPNHSGRGDRGDQIAKGGAELTKFLQVNGGQTLNYLLSMGGQTQFHAAAIR